jgi:hypothetical protein
MSNTAKRLTHSKEASFLAVVSIDPASFVVALMLFCTGAIVLGIYVHSQVTGIQPKESWIEISVGLALITAAFLAVIIYRVRVINRLLREGIRHGARIDRFLAIGIWVIVQLVYERHGIQSERKIWLANSRRSRRLRSASAITLAMDPAHSTHVVITELFL